MNGKRSDHFNKMCQSARVYRSYLKKLHQKNEKATIQNEQFEKQSEELKDRTRDIANYFCDWVQGIPGEDVNCNPQEDEILGWFAIGQDALEFQESHTCANSNIEPAGNRSCSRVKHPLKKAQASHHSTTNDTYTNQKTSSKKQADPLKKGCSTDLPSDELVEIQSKKLELEAKLYNLNSTSLLRDFKNRQNGTTADRNLNNSSNHVV